LQAAGLNQLNISLDTLVTAKVEFLTSHKGHNKVLQSIEATLDLGFLSCEGDDAPTALQKTARDVVLKNFNLEVLIS